MMEPNTKLAVCFIVPRIERIGGYERQAITLGRALLSQPAIALRVFTDTPATSCAALPEQVRQSCRHIGSRSSLAIYRAFRKEFKKLGADKRVVVHAHALYRFSALGLLAAQHCHVPTVLLLPTEHDAELLFRSNRLSIRAFRPSLMRVSAFVCLSKTMMEEAQRFLTRPKHAVYVPNGVDTRRFHPATGDERLALKNKLGIPFDRMIVFVGRHVARKCGDVLLRAFANCRDQMPANTGLAFVGDGDQQSVWRELARVLGISEKVRFFPGQATPEEFFRAADAFVLPSLFEGMPNVVLEAMACGLPMLATTIGGVSDILGEKFPEQLVPPRDVSALARRLPSLLQTDAHTVGDEMRRHVEAHYSIDAVARLYIDLYEKVLTA